MKTQKKTVSDRFLNGFDTVTNPEETMAGKGCGLKTFGHMGFTGTSYWIDPEKQAGVIILTNVSRDYWDERKNLNLMRRTIGAEFWKSL